MSDGSVVINTKINTNGLNADLGKLSGTVKNAMGSIAGNVQGALVGTAATVATVIGVVGGIAVAIGGALIAFVDFGKKLTDTLSNALGSTSGYRDQVDQLKQAFDSLNGAFLAASTTLLSAITPILMTIIEWLTKALNYASMFIAALMGQKTVMQYVSGSADGAANSAGRLAKNTEKAGKAAKGALAAFDQLNVLQKDTADNSGVADLGGVSGGSGGNVMLKETPIDNGILDAANNIKQWFKDAGDFIAKTWDLIVKWSIDAWNNIVLAWNDAGVWFKTNITDPLSKWFTEAWGNISKFASDALKNISANWNNFSDWFRAKIIDPIAGAFNSLWDFVSILANNAKVTILYLWALVSIWFKENVTDKLTAIFSSAWDAVKKFAQSAWDKVLMIWAPIKTWLNNDVSTPIQNSFGTALDWVKTKWEIVFNSIREFTKGILNNIIGLINTLFSGSTIGINALIGSFNNIGGRIPGWSVIPSISTIQIPKLATGAVIPANSEFAAILGDNKSQKELVGPENMFREIVAEVVDSRLQDHLQDQQITINFAGSLGALVGELKPYIDAENRRVGTSLIRGFTGSKY